MPNPAYKIVVRSSQDELNEAILETQHEGFSLISDLPQSCSRVYWSAKASRNTEVTAFRRDGVWIAIFIEST